MWWIVALVILVLIIVYWKYVAAFLSGLLDIITTEFFCVFASVVFGIWYCFFGDPEPDTDQAVVFEKKLDELTVKNNVRLSSDIIYNLGEISRKYRVHLDDNSNRLDFSADDTMDQLQKVFPNDGRLFVAPEVSWDFVGKSSLAIRAVEGQPVNYGLCALINERASQVVHATFGCVQAPEDKDTYIWQKL